MKTIEIYRNYGVLAAEKRNVYTHAAEHEHATCSDKLTVEIPEGWDLWENDYGMEMVTAPWGWNYTIDDVLAGNENPAFVVVDKDDKMHRILLNIVG